MVAVGALVLICKYDIFAAPVNSLVYNATLSGGIEARYGHTILRKKVADYTYTRISGPIGPKF